MKKIRIFVDEAPTMIQTDAAKVLAEARKYDFGLIAATQFDKQFDKNVESSFYKNSKAPVEKTSFKWSLFSLFKKKN